MIGRMTTKQLCFLILSDLETNFNDQTAGKKWNFGQDGATFRASYNIYLQSNVAGTIPYKEWIEKRECHNCGELGHIARNCPHRDRQKQKRERRRDYERQRQQDNAGIDDKDKAKAERKQRRFEKVFAAALKQDEESQSGSESEAENKANFATEEPEDAGAESDDTSDSSGLRAHALRMYDAFRG